MYSLISSCKVTQLAPVLLQSDFSTMSTTDHDHRLATSNHACFSRIMDGSSSNLDIAAATREQSNGGGQVAAVLTYLTFLEHKIGHLRGILCSTPCPRQQQQIVSAEISCIIVQLVSVSKSLVAGTGTGEEADDFDFCRSPPLLAHGLGSDDSDDQDGHHHHTDGEEERMSAPPPPSGSYEVIQIDREEILAPHVHFCKVCGKGFKRDANLRMHMRGHGDEYKTAAALSKPPPPPPSSSSSRDAQAPPETPAPAAARRCYYSCPYVGCKRNKEHRDFQPLKTPVCVKNHYRRSHCDKSHTCRRCNVKKFSVLADLRTHEKHCGRDCWVCSCGTSFSRKDKLFAHVAVFDGHTPALPPDETATATATAASFGGSGMPVSGQQQLPTGGEALSMDQCFSNSMFDDFISCSDIKGSSMDDERGFLSPMGLDSCNFDGFDLFGAPAIDFDF